MVKSTQEIKVPKKIVDQVIGQDEAVEIIKKAALQRRHVLLIGEPGTGKSMLGLALAELLPKEKLKDLLALNNPHDENKPLIRTIAAGKGRQFVKHQQLSTSKSFKNNNFFIFLMAIVAMIAPWWARYHYQSDLMFTAFFLGSMMFLVGFIIFMNINQKMMPQKNHVSKLIVDNFSQEQSPFYDATGAHAGALLGDVLHDPFQTFFTEQELQILENNKINTKKINEQIDNLMNKYQDKILKKKEKNYEAVHLPKNELFLLGETNGYVSSVEVLSSNRYDYGGKMIKLTTSENKELIVTPEHKIAVWQDGKIIYLKARSIKKGDEVVAKSEDILIDEQDIINTYDQKQQEQCKTYYRYKKIKKENPAWGYKRISKFMGQPEAKTRWWYAGKHLPVPIQTVKWLKERKLLPLKINNPKLPLISKILGATFGDGGIFENLNAIFLSSSELEATQEFGSDLMNIFGFSIDNNIRTIEGGIEGHSFCYQNTNRNIIRFFKALGSPIGKKTNIPFIIPSWIQLNKEWKREFFGSLLGSEVGIPKVHISKKFVNTLDFAITAKPELEENRISFLNKLRDYLEENKVNTGKISKRKSGDSENCLFRILMSTKFESLNYFVGNIKINYCRYKKEKIIKTFQEIKEIKRKKYHELIEKGYGAEHAMKLLQITPKSLYLILN